VQLLPVPRHGFRSPWALQMRQPASVTAVPEPLTESRLGESLAVLRHEPKVQLGPASDPLLAMLESPSSIARRSPAFG
jgi:hypothetical protein